MEATLNSNRRTARLAGFLFFFGCIPLVTWSQSYVLSRIFVSQDPAATADNLLSNEFLFRTGIVTHVASNITFAFVGLLLYRLFRPVDKHLSRLMLAPVMAQVPIFLILEVFNITALMILKSENQISFDAGQKQELAFFLMGMHRNGIGAAQLFWGLFFIPFGLLVFRSGFLPRIFGILSVIGGIGYVTDGCTFILLQRPDYLMVRQFVIYVIMMGMPTMLWLLIKGAREQKASLVS